MAKKDVMRYYDQVCDQYVEMMDNLTEMTEAVENQIISPERFEAFKASIEPMKNNYMRISYIVFLMNKPTKLREWFDKVLEKFGKITKLNKIKKAFDNTATEEAVIKENKEIIDNMKI